MLNNTFIFSKDSLTDTEVVFDISPLLKFGETLTSVIFQPISPQTVPPLGIALLSAADSPQVSALLTGGLVKTAYGCKLLITTSGRVLTALIAVSVVSDVTIPYTTQNPDAYVDLVDSIEAGTSAVGTAVFSFPPGVDPAGGYVNWEFLDSSGTTYANGNAFDYRIQSNGLSNTVFARAIINVPSTVPPSDTNSKYQLRYTLKLPDPTPGSNPQQTDFYSYENLTVIGLSTIPTGTQDGVELRGNRATMSIVVDALYDNVTDTLYKDNTPLGSTSVTEYQRTSAGYYYAASFDTTNMVESLEPYSVVWNYGNKSDVNNIATEDSALWIVNPTIMRAINDVKAKINKARTTLYGQPDLLFPPSTVLLWLRRGRDSFNGSPGGFTTFTFLNAKGAVREYWLMYAELGAIEAQYMAEGEKAFNFSGAAISLDVDRTGYLDSAASKIQQRLDNEMKAFKQNLIIKGATGGDGSIDPSKLQRGALGSVGITITPASPWGPYRSGLPYPTGDQTWEL